MTSPTHLHGAYRIKSKNVDSGKDFVTSNYLYRSTKIQQDENGSVIVEPVERYYMFRTDKRVPKLGVLLVGIGGNNGTTVTGAVLANKHNITWNTKEGTQYPNYFGSLSQATTTFLGCNQQNQQVYVPLKSLIPMVDPNNLVIHGWDINDAPLDKAMHRACVFDYALQEKLVPYLKEMQPMKSIYYPDFIAANQTDRANNVYDGDRACFAHLAILRNDIKQFKATNDLDKVIVIWTANTERYSDVLSGVHDTEDNFLAAIKNGHTEIAPSQMFAAASILEGCAFVNGSPQNTFCPALIEMARKRGVFIGGDDFKSGQTKIKSVLVDFLVASGIKPESIVSYNHLGNNDGKNLNEAKQFRSKEISKSNVRRRRGELESNPVRKERETGSLRSNQVCAGSQGQ
jgi:myo-inositol-1-phosphate synthase